MTQLQLQHIQDAVSACLTPNPALLKRTGKALDSLVASDALRLMPMLTTTHPNSVGNTVCRAVQALLMRST